jgi:hypothetical protein
MLERPGLNLIPITLIDPSLRRFPGSVGSWEERHRGLSKAQPPAKGWHPSGMQVRAKRPMWLSGGQRVWLNPGLMAGIHAGCKNPSQQRAAKKLSQGRAAFGQEQGKCSRQEFGKL